jgi:hypothetical protein
VPLGELRGIIPPFVNEDVTEFRLVLIRSSVEKSMSDCQSPGTNSRRRSRTISGWAKRSF